VAAAPVEAVATVPAAETILAGTEPMAAEVGEAATNGRRGLGFFSR
jgi:hypothetical protein